MLSHYNLANTRLVSLSRLLKTRSGRRMKVGDNKRYGGMRTKSFCTFRFGKRRARKSGLVGLSAVLV